MSTITRSIVISSGPRHGANISSYFSTEYRFGHLLLRPAAQTMRQADKLADIVVEELRRRRILLPTRSALEAIIHVAIRRGIRIARIAHQALAGELSEVQKLGLDKLLDPREGTSLTVLAWVRTPALSLAAANLDRIAERIRFLRSLNLSPALMERIPAKVFEEFAAEVMRTSVQHLRDLNPERRHAILAATALHLSRHLTDCAIDMFKKIMGVLTRRADNRAAARVTRSVREVQKPLKDVSKVCHAIIEAREKGEDIAKAIERAIQWPAFTLSVEAVDTLIAPDVVDGKIDMLQRYPTIRKLAPQFLSTLVFRGHAVAGNLLRALSVVADLYRTGKRAMPDKAPISFAPKGWMPLILQDGKIDRKAYELCLFSELKRRLNAGDVWVEGAKRFQSFESFLIPTPTFELMREEGPLPIAVHTDVETYLTQQRQILNEGLADLSRLVATGELDDVELTGAGFSVTPYKALFPDIAKALKAKVEGRLPAIRITDLLLEVDARTGFSPTPSPICAAAGRPTTSLRFSPQFWPMASISASQEWRTFLPASRCGSWHGHMTGHIREDGYTVAHAILVNAQRQLPLASLWGNGTTSSSDGQYFPAGGHAAEAIGDLNARLWFQSRRQILSVYVRPVWGFLHCRHERQCQRGNLCPRRTVLSRQRSRYRDPLCRYRRGQRHELRSLPSRRLSACAPAARPQGSQAPPIPRRYASGEPGVARWRIRQHRADQGKLE